MIVQVAFGKVDRNKPKGGHRNTYAYWSPKDARLWDRVVVPPNWAHGESQIATVVGFGRQGYAGSLSAIEAYVLEPYTPTAPLPMVIEGGEVSGFDYDSELRRRLLAAEKRVARLEMKAASGKALEELRNRFEILERRVRRLGEGFTLDTGDGVTRRIVPGDHLRLDF